MDPRGPEDSGYYPETDGAEAAYNHNILFYPGIYSPSGFDLMKILYHVATRPNPVIDLGPVDVSCPIVLCDLFMPDTPAVYASDSFLSVTGYSRDEILGRNCRFLQNPPPAEMAPPPPPYPAVSSSSTAAGLSDSYLPSSGMPHASGNYSYSHTNNSHAKSPGPCVPAHIRQLLHHSVSHNKEVQVEVTNFRKDGSQWENVLSIVPIYWDDDGSQGGAGKAHQHRDGKSKSKSRSPQQRRYRYSVGFACDKEAMGM